MYDPWEAGDDFDRAEGCFKFFFAGTFLLSAIISLAMIAAIVVGIVLLWRNFA